MSLTVVGTLFLGVSLTAVVIQSISLSRLRRAGPPETATGRMAYRGLLRTAATRVVAASLYVTLGVTTLLSPTTSTFLALSLFALTQATWIFSSFLDVRLRRRISDPIVHGRHRSQ